MFLSIGVGQLLLPVKLHKAGRRLAYMIGAVSGLAGCLVITLGCMLESFALICFGACLEGISIADGQNYRLGAMTLTPSAKERAAGRVLGGGVLGAFIGPGALTRARKLVPEADFAGVFVLCCVMHALVLIRLFGVLKLPIKALHRPHPDHC